MKNKLLLSTLALSIATPAIVVPFHPPAHEVSAATYNKVFKDVTKANPNYDIIHEMAAKGVIKGYSDNSFKGGNSITRYQAATLVYRYLGDKLPIQNPNATIPSDVSPKSEHYSAAVALLKADLLEAGKDGKLHPNEPITRAEMAKILAVGFDVKIKAQYDFADTMEGDEETRDYVRALYSNGITTGYLEDATFRPEKSLTRQQFAVFMHRSIHIDPNFVAEPIVIPPKAETPVEPPVTPSDRYAINLEQTPKEVLAKYSTKVEDVKTDFIKSPNVGLTPNELFAYQQEQFKQYKEYIMGNITTGFAAEDLINRQRHIQLYAEASNLTYDEMVQVFHYVQQTGAVYKGYKITVYYKYSEQNSRNFYISRRDR